MYFEHIPVLQSAVISILKPSPGDAILDVTLGLGGHSLELLRRALPDGSLIGIDADERNLHVAVQTLKAHQKKVQLIHANFRDLPACLPDPSERFDLILADLGLSSPHVDDPSRGFTLRPGTPLDMRYDRKQGVSASAYLMDASEEELTNTFREYAELPRAHRLARAIVDRRREGQIATSDDLRPLVRDVYGYRTPSILPQVFQALRIVVNDELSALDRLLDIAPTLLKPGGRLGIISYHSLEDARVKRRFRELTSSEKDPVTGAVATESAYTLLTRKPLRPLAQEVEENPRARSGLLRAMQRKLRYTHP